MYDKRDQEEYKEKVQNLLNIVTVYSKLLLFSVRFLGRLPPQKKSLCPPPVAGPEASYPETTIFQL